MIALTLFLMGGILFPLLLGYALIRTILDDEFFSKSAMSAFSFGLGMGVISLWMLVLATAGIRLSLANIFTPLALFALGLSALRYFKPPEKSSASLRPRSVCPCLPLIGRIPAGVFLSLLALYVFYQLAFVFFHAWSFPVTSYDAIHAVAMKAKVFFFDGDVRKLRDLPLSAYPLQVPFFMTWTALVLGQWNEPWIMLVFPSFFVAFLVIHFAVLRIYTDRSWSLLGVALLVSANLFTWHAWIGYRDQILSYYNIGAVIGLLAGYQYSRPGYFILAGIFSGLASVCKLEGSAYLILHALLAGYILLQDRTIALRQKGRRFLGFISPAAGVYLLYCFFILTQHLPLMEGRVGMELPGDWGARSAMVLRTFLESLFLCNNWNLLWFLLVASLVTRHKTARQFFEVKFLLLALGLFLSFYLAVDLLTSNFHHLSGRAYPTVLSRVILHFFPLAVLLIVLLNARREKKGYADDPAKVGGLRDENHENK